MLIALAKLKEEEADDATLQVAMGTSPDDASHEAEEKAATEAAVQEGAEAEAAAAEMLANPEMSAALSGGEVTADSVEAAAAAAEKYWQAAQEAAEKAKADAEAAAEAAREAEAKAVEEAKVAAIEEEARAQVEAERQAAILQMKADIAAEKAAAAAAAGGSAEAADPEEPAENGPPAAEPPAEAEASGASDADTDATTSRDAGGALRLEVGEMQTGRSIASGAEAEVFRGLLWGQKVAVKQLKTVADDGTEKEVSQITRELQHETRILSKLNHPGILTLIGYTEEPAQIVLEVLEGTVYDLVSSGGVDSCDGGLLGPLSDILSGCAYLHALSVPILHRDLKPPNVLHDERMRCKLCDFGTAIELQPHKPQPSEWIGSQLYVAPEVDRQDAYGLPADVFSFGVLAIELYHQLSTGVNFYGEGDMFDGGGMFEGLEVLRAPLLAEPPEQPPRPDTLESDALWDLLMSTVAQSPDDRPSFSKIARGVGEIRQALAGGALAEWL